MLRVRHPVGSVSVDALMRAALKLLRIVAPLACALVVSACSAQHLPPAASPGPLAGCRMEEDAEARTWTCGDLIAQEFLADPATEAESRQVLETFAKSFTEARAARTDVRWALGAESFPSVRLEGTTAEGQRFTAQMIVVSRPDGARVVQCASKSPVAPCEPVLDHLVRSEAAGPSPGP